MQRTLGRVQRMRWQWVSVDVIPPRAHGDPRTLLRPAGSELHIPDAASHYE